MVILFTHLQRKWRLPVNNHEATTFNFIGKTSEFSGDLIIDGNTHIFGKFCGSITGRDNATITIEYTGQVEGNISGLNVVIHGQLLGDVTEANKIEVTSTAKIKGTLAAKDLQIFPGAKINGQLISLKA